MVTTTTTIKRFVGYIRVSTERQAKEGRSSLETQEARIRATVSAQGGLLVKVFCDIESGKRNDRPEYQKMLKYVLEEDVDVVLVQYLDRFGRQPREILSRTWALGEHGVSVEATDQDIKDDELVLLVHAGVAGQESKRTSERVRANMGNSARKGTHGGKAPYGFRPIREIRDGRAVIVRWEIVDPEAEIIREMARLSSEENIGFKAIADNLNERGMRRETGHWVASSIQQILRNPVIKGLMVYGRDQNKLYPPQELIEVPGVFPPILTEEEWDTLQKRMDIRRGTPRGSVHRSNYLLSGIARCGHCGGPMSGKSGAKYKGQPYRSYQCVRAIKAKEACAYSNSHPAKRFEPVVLEYLGQFSDPKRVAALLKETGQTEIKRKKTELTKLEKQLRTLDSDFHKNLDYLKRSLLNEEEFSKANAERRDDRAGVEMRLAVLREELHRAETARDAVTSLPERITTFVESFEQLETPKAKAMLQMILKAAYVWTDGRVELEFR
ncbi:MAG: recombinase family protein [Chloroflexi bacterium]|nr:recombinase family protein [Chloroflexota bacterium]